jgi:hypothetical protein
MEIRNLLVACRAAFTLFVPDTVVGPVAVAEAVEAVVEVARYRPRHGDGRVNDGRLWTAAAMTALVGRPASYRSGAPARSGLRLGHRLFGFADSPWPLL